MDKILRPERFDADPSASGATKSWIHWKRTFENFLAVLLDENIDKFRVLTNFVSPTVFEFIEECTTYEAALERTSVTIQYLVLFVFVLFV